MHPLVTKSNASKVIYQSFECQYLRDGLLPRSETFYDNNLDLLLLAEVTGAAGGLTG